MFEHSSKVQDSELEILQVFWAAGQPLMLAELCTRLNASRGWADSTVKTLLRRMQEKGLVRLVRRGVYEPLLTEAEHSRHSARSLVSQLFGGNAKNLVAALVHDGQLSEADLAELSAMLAALPTEQEADVDAHR